MGQMVNKSYINPFSGIDENNHFYFCNLIGDTFLDMLIEDCPSLDAAPVPAYWMLRRRQPP